MFAAILPFIPLIITAISFVEKMWTGAGQGSIKKSAVIAGVEAIATGMQTVSTGGQLGTWTEIKDGVPQAIDALVGLYNIIGFPKYTGVAITDDMGIGFTSY